MISTPVTAGLLRGAAELPLPDQLHPDTATHRRIGERFAKLAFTGLGEAHMLGVPEATAQNAAV